MKRSSAQNITTSNVFNSYRSRHRSYTCFVSPEQEEQLCDALVGLGPLETELGLHAEGVRTIQDVLQCSREDARAALRELRLHKRIEETTTPEHQVPERRQGRHFRWVRPPAPE